MPTKQRKGAHKGNIDKTIDALEADIHKKKVHKSIPQYDSSEYIFRQRLVWTTVIFLGISVFGIWGWHMRTVFYDASRGSIGNPSPLQSAGTYFEEAMLIAGNKEENIPLPTETTTTQQDIILEEPPIPSPPTPTKTLDTLIDSLNTLTTTTSSTVTSTQ